MNIQRKNSAHHFRMQSEREQTLVMNKGDVRIWLNQSSRQRHYFLDSICSALITRELGGPKLAGCSILEFSFVSSESGA